MGSAPVAQDARGTTLLYPKGVRTPSLFFTRGDFFLVVAIGPYETERRVGGAMNSGPNG